METISQPWPWYIAGPLIGLMVPLLLFLGNKTFGVSSSLRHVCAATIPAKVAYFKYDWKSYSWNLLFVAGMVVGAFLVSTFLPNPIDANLSAKTAADLQAIGVDDHTGLVPASLFNWRSLLTVPGFVLIVIGGFLVGFGTRYADGCTSGHGITGLANLQLTSLIAVIGFFAGGLFIVHMLLPFILGAGR